VGCLLKKLIPSRHSLSTRQAIEAQARAVRAIADEKRKVASALKDDACKTHWGGKFLCLRPFNSGY
jgi:hypothetical protein